MFCLSISCYQGQVSTGFHVWSSHSARTKMEFVCANDWKRKTKFRLGMISSPAILETRRFETAGIDRYWSGCFLNQQFSNSTSMFRITPESTMRFSFRFCVANNFSNFQTLQSAKTLEKRRESLGEMGLVRWLLWLVRNSKIWKFCNKKRRPAPFKRRMQPDMFNSCIVIRTPTNSNCKISSARVTSKISKFFQWKQIY